jgi:hypothetical protein
VVNVTIGATLVVSTGSATAAVVHKKKTPHALIPQLNLLMFLSPRRFADHFTVKGTLLDWRMPLHAIISAWRYQPNVERIVSQLGQRTSALWLSRPTFC